MSIGLGIVIAVVAIILFFNNLSLRSDLEQEKDLNILLKRANNQLSEQLQCANQKIDALTNKRIDELIEQLSLNNIQHSYTPSFLLADDPMDALLDNVGKIKK